MKQIESGEKYFEIEELSSENRFNELLMTGLRTIWGVNITQLETLECTPSSFNEQINCSIFKMA